MSSQPIKSKLIRITDDYLLRYPTERERIKPLLADLHSSSDIFDRKSIPGHITASGIVQKKTKILMIFHPILNKWLQPGGHVEPGEMPLEAAKREIVEETGIYCSAHPWHQENIMPFDIDIHHIPVNPEKCELSHLHYDFRYLLCPENMSVIKKDKHVTRWILTTEIEEPHLICLVEKMRHL
jgi:8-oxo-dGTP pyrophosphatase MutT (NUDIX family)